MANLHWGKRNTPRKRKKYVFRERAQQKIFASVIRMNEDRYPDLKFINGSANGGARDIGTGRHLKETGVRAGFWDIVWMKKSYVSKVIENGQHMRRDTIFYHGLCIEMKFGKNKLTTEQKEWEEFYRLNGYMTVVAYDALEALEAIELYASIALHGKPSRASLQ